jgi:hypothetical protein
LRDNIEHSKPGRMVGPVDCCRDNDDDRIQHTTTLGNITLRSSKRPDIKSFKSLTLSPSLYMGKMKAFPDPI